VGQHNIIELNGKQYDALTGALLGESRIAATPATKATHLQRQGRNMDGFIRAKGPANNLKPVVVKPTPTPDDALEPRPISHAVSHPKQGKSMGGIKAAGAGGGHRTAKTLAHHQPEKPKTLMRHVVKKPKANMKPAIKTTVPAEMMARPKSTLAKPLEKKMSVMQVNPVRLGRARQVPKSHHIQRFNAGRQQSNQQIPSPANIAEQAGTASLRPTQQYTARPVRQDFRPGAQAIAAIAAPAGSSQAPQQASQIDSTDIFEAALAHATSHEQQSPVLARRRQARRKRLMNVMAGLGAFLVIAGFLAYLNRPAIELRVASMRAGFHAEMPNYKPTGYALEGGVKTSNGRVAMQFRSGENNYWITQEASDWNSSTLLDQSSEQRGAPTRTIQSKGRTIYIYNDTSATWVNGGVRYEINGNSSLDAGELVSLATSM
jgi:hypothetical protein